jgi:hypothetical protein
VSRVNVPIRFKVGLQPDGTVVEGKTTRRQYAVATAVVEMLFDTDDVLHLGLLPDVAQYHYDDDSLWILVPMLSAEWIEVPGGLRNSRVRQACATGEIKLRLATRAEQRELRATCIESARWLSPDPLAEAPRIRERLLVQLGRDGELNNNAAASKVTTVEDPTDMYRVELSNLVLPRRSSCIFCDAANPTTSEHAVPAWARPPGEPGITVASCERCNNALSPLESAVADVSRQAPVELRVAEHRLLFVWAVKTIWVISRSLGLDGLRGSGDNLIQALIGTEPARTNEEATRWELVGDHSSIEPSQPGNYLTLSIGDADPSWAVLQVSNLAISIWFSPVSGTET